MRPTNLCSSVKVTTQTRTIDWYGTEENKIYHVDEAHRISWLKKGDLVFRREQVCFFLSGDTWVPRSAFASEIDSLKLRSFGPGDKLEVKFSN